MEPLQIIIVDDQKLFRENLKIVIEIQIPEAKVVGIAANGREALEICQQRSHNLILLDMRMPEMNGVEFIRRLRAQGDNSKVIVLTTFDDDEYVFEALRMGAVGYLLKEINPDELTKAIITVQNGDKLVSPKITAKLVNEVTKYWTVDAVTSTAPLAKLTPRELEVLRHVALGEGNREIAASLQLSDGTVKNYISSIYEKLEFKDRAQAIRYAFTHGLL